MYSDSSPDDYDSLPIFNNDSNDEDSDDNTLAAPPTARFRDALRDRARGDVPASELALRLGYAFPGRRRRGAILQSHFEGPARTSSNLVGGDRHVNLVSADATEALLAGAGNQGYGSNTSRYWRIKSDSVGGYEAELIEIPNISLKAWQKDGYVLNPTHSAIQNFQDRQRPKINNWRFGFMLAYLALTIASYAIMKMFTRTEQFDINIEASELPGVNATLIERLFSDIMTTYPGRVLGEFANATNKTITAFKDVIPLLVALAQRNNEGFEPTVLPFQIIVCVMLSAALAEITSRGVARPVPDFLVSEDSPNITTNSDDTLNYGEICARVKYTSLQPFQS